jgi:hypothetical protein
MAFLQVGFASLSLRLLQPSSDLLSVSLNLNFNEMCQVEQQFVLVCVGVPLQEAISSLSHFVIVSFDSFLYSHSCLKRTSNGQDHKFRSRSHLMMSAMIFHFMTLQISRLEVSLNLRITFLSNHCSIIVFRFTAVNDRTFYFLHEKSHDKFFRFFFSLPLSVSRTLRNNP